jgi:amidohydrolase
MIFDKLFLNELFALRRELHQMPELSGKEFLTSEKLIRYVASNQPEEIITQLEGTGFAAIFDGKIPGKTLLFRAEMDALPIFETNDFGHKSAFAGISHKCGHDGHATILAGLSHILHQNPIKSGKVILLFQPAEETGNGAKAVLSDEKFERVKPDFVFALHNLPGFPLNQIIVGNRHFAAASKGMIVKLFGKTAHAAYPESGISPALAMTGIIRDFIQLSLERQSFQDFVLLTIIHSRLGDVAFGTSPGYAEVMATLRSYNNRDMEILTQKAIKIVEEIVDKYVLTEKISFTDEFPATVNHPEAVDLVRKSAIENGYKIHEITQPFRWSEDFGHFTNKFPGAFFGIGSGKNHPDLHNPDYDFPDEIIETGIKMFDGIAREILK